MSKVRKTLQELRGKPIWKIWWVRPGRKPRPDGSLYVSAVTYSNVKPNVGDIGFINTEGEYGRQVFGKTNHLIVAKVIQVDEHGNPV